jgi:hypothetical protein
MNRRLENWEQEYITARFFMVYQNQIILSSQPNHYLEQDSYLLLMIIFLFIFSFLLNIVFSKPNKLMSLCVSIEFFIFFSGNWQTKIRNMKREIRKVSTTFKNWSSHLYWLVWWWFMKLFRFYTLDNLMNVHE